MIKAKKGLLITLFAAMMIFAFGATSVFAAAPTASWDGYDKVTLSGGTEADAVYNGTYETVKTFDATTGRVNVAVKDPEIVGLNYATLSGYAGTKTYYDLNNAVFTADGTKEIGATYLNAASWTAPTGLLFKAPSGTYEGTAPAPKYISASDLNGLGGNWVGVITTDPATVEAAESDHPVTVKLDVSYTTATATAGFVGAVPDKTITIKGEAIVGDPTAAKLFIDEVKETGGVNNIVTAYDGKEHTVAITPISGYTVKFKVFNKGTGNWDEVSAVTFKDAAAAVNARAEFFKTTNTTTTPDYTKNFTVTVNKAGAPTIAFTTDSAAPSTFVTGQYDPWDLVVLDNVAEADTTAVMDYFKAAYEIKEESTSAFDKTAYKWTIAKKADAPKEEDFAVLANYAAPGLGTNTTKYVTIQDSFDSEIEFVDTPSAITFKAKKLKKKAASFTVTAVCNDGTPVAYKLINAPEKITIDKTSGEITLAKGLKKGKYNVTVKAYIPGVPSYYGLFETQAIKIKVKK